MKYYLLIFLMAFMLFEGVSQEKIPYIDLDKISEKLSTKSEREAYENNLEQLNKINKNDSSYCSVLISKSYYLINLERYDDAIRITNEGLTRDCYENHLSFYVNKGLSYTYSKKFDEALAVFDEGLKKFPKNAKLWHNKGFTHEKANQIEKAVAAYQEAIRLKPTYPNPHLQLGNICYKQQLITQALMCFNVYLLLSIDETNAFSTLQSLNNIVAERNESEANVNLEISEDDEAFEELNLILDNKIALNNKYETGHKINIPLTKQNHVLLQQIRDFDGNEGFWDKKYVPLFTWIAENELFENFIYTLCYPIKNEKYAKIIQNNEKNIVDFIGKFYDKLRSVMKTNEVEIDGKTQEVTNYYFNNYTQAVGLTKGDTSVGKWLIYDAMGQLTSEGFYDDDGDRDKKWIWYHPNGSIKETAVYENKKLNGKNFQFYENGKPYIETTFKDGKLNGEYLLYNNKGALYEKKHFKDGALDGMYNSYFNVGETIPEWNISYKNGEVASEVIEYYDNGDVYAQIPFNNGKRHGVEKKFHFNQKSSAEINYENGELSGPYRTFHINGNIRQEGVCSDNFYQGSFKTFYQNGNLESDETYINGNLNGICTYYDRDGKLYNEFTYRKGEVLAYKYFNKNGEIIKEAKKKGGEFEYIGFSAEGIKFSEGLYDIKGGKEGLWKFYSNNGVLTSEGSYTDNKAFGAHVSYYNNGVKESITNYENDSIVGYYANYYKNGQLKQQGWYKENSTHGEWRNYYIDGTLKEINFYHKGKLHGSQELFGVDGRPERTYIYKYGDIISEVYFDEEGNTLGELNYQSDKNSFIHEYKFKNGQTKVLLEYVNGVKHGKYENYDFYGNLLINGTYKNGEMDGKWVWYHSNGNINVVNNYRSGTRHGEYEEFHENGQVEEKGVYVVGKKEGTVKSFHQNGIQSHLTTYSNDMLHGKKIFYGVSGNIQLIRHYNYDRLVGYSYLDNDSVETPIIPIEKETKKIKAYYNNGNISRELEYKNGDLVNSYKEYYYSGKLESKMSYNSGELHDTLINFYENGNKKSIYPYKQGMLHGLVIKYYEDGTLKEEIQYANDIKNGLSKYYKTNGDLIKEEVYFNGDIAKSKVF